MKIKFAAFAAVLPLVTAAHGASVLLGGYYGLNESGAFLQSPTLAGSGIVTSLVRTGVSTDITQGISQINSANWGNTTLDVAAPTIGNGDDSRNAIVQSAVVDASDNPQPFTLILTVTNGGTADLSLDSIHFWVKKDINNQGPNEQTLTYTAGDLTDATGTTTGTFGLANGVNGYDVALNSFLTDTMLGAGESASFTWSHGLAEDPAGNTAIRIDNLAISGFVVPEPSTVWLGCLGLFGLLRRRR